MEEKRDEVVTQDSTERVEGSSIAKGYSLIIIFLVALIIIGGYIFYYTNRSAKKVEDIGTSDGGERSTVSFEEIHKFSPSNLESSSSEDKTDENGKQHFNAGVRFSLRRDYDRAIEEYRKALEYEPTSAGAYSNIGFAYMDKGDIERAIVEHRKALELDPQLANAYYGLALALEKKGDIEEAIKNWEKYLEIAPPGTVWWNKAKERLDKMKRDE